MTSAGDTGPNTLRQALIDVCAGGTITFGGDYAIDLASTLEVTKDVTIDGTGHTVTLNGGSSVRIMRMSGLTVTLQHLTLTNGRAAGLGDGDGGAGVTASSGTLSVIGCTFSGNSAGGDGGCVLNSGGTLYVTASVFSGNNANYGGAVVSLGGTSSISTSTFANNAAVYGGALGSAGATLTINNSTFSGNTANPVWGGALSSWFSNVTITNSTFSGNSANTAGGAVVCNSESNSNTMAITNSTFSANTAADGGGVANFGCLLTMTNTILTGNTNVNCSGTISGSNNLMYGSGTCGTSPLTDDPKLAALANNGGPTQTMALLAGSPAIDAGNATVCAASPVSGLDQRGVARAAGHCSIGACEALPPALSVTRGATTIANGGSFDFGAAAIGGPITLTFTVSNPNPTDITQGQSGLVLGSLSTMPSGFELASGFASPNLAQGGSTTFAVTLLATASGTFTGDISFTHNATQSPFTFTVTGLVCSAGQYANGTTCSACAVCSPSPSEGHPNGQYQTQACGVTSNTVCSDCTACTAGQYQTAGCQADGVATANRVCASCTACSLASSAEHPNGQYQTQACGATTNTVCTDCSGACPFGSYVWVECTATEDRVCRQFLPPPDPTPDAGVPPAPDAGVDAAVVVDAALVVDAQPDTVGEGDTQVMSPPDAAAPKFDTRVAQDTRPTPPPDSASVRLDALVAIDTPPAPDTRPQADGPVVSSPDALVAGLDAPVLDAGFIAIDTRAADAELPISDDAGNAPIADARPGDARTGDAGSPVTKKSSSGCSCDLSRGRHHDTGALALLVVGLVLATRRRRP